MSSFFYFLPALIIIFVSRVGYAGSCCARSAALPVLIVGDDEAQVNLGFSQSSFEARAEEFGALNPGKPDVRRVCRLEASVLASDRVQVGLGLSFTQRSSTTLVNQQKTGAGFGDVRLSVGYEILPLWSYSNWKPQGFLYSVLTLPTGRSRYETQDLQSSSDVTGGGFYSISVGSLFLKRWSDWDVFLMPEVHYGLARSFFYIGTNRVVRPGLGGSVGFGVGWSPGGGNLRMGARLQSRIDQGKSVDGYPVDPTEMNGDVGFDLAYLFNPNLTAMLSYTDQTLIPLAKNSNLDRVVAVNLQYRWER